MITTFDLLSIAVFAGLAVLYLHRSSRAEGDRVPIWAYGLAALACAAANGLGNAGQVLAAAALLTGAAAFGLWAALTRAKPS